MNIITCIDIELTTEDVKKIIAEFINKKFGTTINTDQNNIDMPCFDHATVHCRFSTETIQVDKERGLIRRQTIDICNPIIIGRNSFRKE